MTPIVLRVAGVPQPKGSTRAFMPKGARFPVVTSDNPQLKAWENAVRQAATLAARGRTPFDGPIEITAVFSFQRPKSVKAEKRPCHTVKPDSSKLLRAIEDPLSGVIYVDDAQIIATHVFKQYAETPGADITIHPAVVSDGLFSGKAL